jgi:hypothetical protein
MSATCKSNTLPENCSQRPQWRFVAGFVYSNFEYFNHFDGTTQSKTS